MFLGSNPKPPPVFFELYSPANKPYLLYALLISLPFTKYKFRKPKEQKKRKKRRLPLELVRPEKRRLETRREPGNRNRPKPKRRQRRQTRKSLSREIRPFLGNRDVVPRTLACTKHRALVTRSNYRFPGDISMKIAENDMVVKWVS